MLLMDLLLLWPLQTKIQHSVLLHHLSHHRKVHLFPSPPPQSPSRPVSQPTLPQQVEIPICTPSLVTTLPSSCPASPDSLHSEQTFLDNDSDCDLEETEENEELHRELSVYSGGPITLNASHLLVTAYVNRHQLSRSATDDLLKLISLHCPAPNRCFTSTHTLQAHKHSPALNDIPLVQHFFCSECNIPIQIYPAVQIQLVRQPWNEIHCRFLSNYRS